MTKTDMADSIRQLNVDAYVVAVQLQFICAECCGRRVDSKCQGCYFSVE